MIYYISYVNRHGHTAFWSPIFARPRGSRPDGVEVRSKEDLPGGRALLKIVPFAEGYRWSAKNNCIGKLIGDRLLATGMASSPRGTCDEWRKKRNKQPKRSVDKTPAALKPSKRACQTCGCPTVNRFSCFPCLQALEDRGEDVRGLSQAVREFDLRRIDPHYDRYINYSLCGVFGLPKEALDWRAKSLELERQLMLQSTGY